MRRAGGQRMRREPLVYKGIEELVAKLVERKEARICLHEMP